MRFCMVTTFYPPHSFGGDAIFVQRLSRALVRRGHEVDVVYCRDAYEAMARGRPPAGPPAEEPGIRLHPLTLGLGGLSPLVTHQTGWPGLKAARLREVLEGAFDVVHFHNISLVGGPGVLRYGRGVKLFTLHEYFLICPTHVLVRNGREACHRKSCVSCTLRHGRPPQVWRYTGLIERALGEVDALVAPSRFCMRRHIAEGIEAPIVHLPYFVPDPLPLPAAGPSVALPEGPFILFAGRVEPLKGLHTLIPVVRRHPSLELVVAGDGSDLPRARALADGCARIRFLGRLRPEELPALYARALAVVLPGLNFEVLPLVMLEAAAAGAPVVARDLGSPAEVVVSHGIGLIYGTDEELTAAFDRLLGDAELRRGLGRKGRETFEREWSEDAHVERYLELVARLDGGRGRGASRAGGSPSMGEARVAPVRPPRAWPLVGHLPRFLADRLGFLDRCAADPRAAVPMRLPGHTLLLKDVEDVAHVLHGRSAIYEKGPLFTRPAGRRLLGRGVHTAGSEAHRALRREVQPLFGSRSVERYAPAILSAADGRLDRWGGAVDLKAEMFELTLDALGLALFGADWHPDLARAMRDRRRCIHYRVAFPVPLLADGLPLPVVRRFRRADARLREAVTVGVARRRAEGEASDLLGGLAGLTGSDGALLPVERIVDEALTLSVTGFETLADGLAWTLHLATAHPAIQERMASEVERALGGEPPGPSSARSLAFVSQVVMESYRLYPPTWLMVRRATQDDMLPSGTPVPRGSKLYVSPWVLGRRERYFPDPLRFDPDRFGEAPGTWPHAAHIPFGTGPRTCLGKPLAELEALIVIARVLQRYELTSASEAPPVPVPGVTLTPRGPVPVRVERRSRPSGRPAPLTSARAGAARAGR